MNQKTKTKVPEGQQGALGVQGTDVTAEAAQMYGMPAGFYIADVLKGSAAEKAGITKGSIIVKVGGPDRFIASLYIKYANLKIYNFNLKYISNDLVKE